MKKLSRNEKMWLLFFAALLISLAGGCLFETVKHHKPIGPRPVTNNQPAK